jgi:transposase
MAKPLLTDELWNRIEPVLPKEPPKPKGGRPRVPDRACLTGILFVLRTGTGWEYLPAEMHCGSGMTCWRRLRDWQAAGVWHKIWRRFLDELGSRDRIEWSAMAVDASSTRAIFGGPPPVRTLPIAGKTARNGI